MGGTTVTASRILRGQLNGHPGEETVLKFEEFPHIAMSKVQTNLGLHLTVLKNKWMNEWYGGFLFCFICLFV